MNPLVSIIIPTYNRKNMVKEAIESVFKQSYTNYELFVIDDGSDDNTFELINQYKDNLYYLYIRNRGVSKARNLGVTLSRGEYISFLDSDDYWLPDKLRKQVRFMEENPNCSVSQTDEIWIKNGERVNPKKKHRKRSGDIFGQSLKLCAVSPSSVMIKKSLFDSVGVFDETFPVCEDYDLWLRISKDHKVLLLNEKLVVKRGGHKDQLSKSRWGLDIYRVKSIEKILNSTSLSSEKRKKAVNELKYKCDILSKGFTKHGKLNIAKYYENLHLKYI